METLGDDKFRQPLCTKSFSRETEGFVLQAASGHPCNIYTYLENNVERKKLSIMVEME